MHNGEKTPLIRLAKRESMSAAAQWGIRVAAILLALVTAVVSMLFGGVADPLSNLVGILTTPVRNGITAVTNWAEEKYNDAFELEQMKEELAGLKQRNAELEAQAREAKQRRQDLVAFLAHDLKTPLTSVLGYLNLLHDEPGLTPEQRAKYTGIALDKARRLEELISEFFDITRMDLQGAGQERCVIHLSILLEQLADEFYPLFAEKGLTCRTDITPQLTTRGDPDKLARVFDNVLRNAVSYSTPGGRVDIQAKTVGRQAEITIRNEGLEIPEGELANIFQKFYRLDAARSSRTGGAGLGLAIAKEIVESHGGNIRCESNGRLTSFVISLPLYKEVRHVFKRNRAGLSEPK